MSPIIPTGIFFSFICKYEPGVAMEVIFFLIGVSFLVAVVFLLAFFWSVKDKQYEDDYTPSVRMLFEEKVSHAHSQNKKSKSDSSNE